MKLTTAAIFQYFLQITSTEMHIDKLILDSNDNDLSCDSSSFSRVTRTHAGWHMSQADITASQSFGAIRDFGAIR